MPQINRRECMKLMAGGLAAGALSGCALSQIQSTQADKRPNIVIFLADDLGYGDMGCQGHRYIKTPVADKMAEEGVRFTSYYAAAPFCSPSRAGMLTGRDPVRTGVYRWIEDGSAIHLQDSEITIPELLKSLGYATCLVGKYHCNGKFNSDEQPQPGDQGFDYWFATQNNAMPTHKDPENFVRNGTPCGVIEGYSSEIITDEAIQWLETVEKDKPFCLFVWFHSVHHVIMTPERYIKMYSDIDYPERGRYYGNVTQLDHEVGRVLDVIDKRGQTDDTFVLYTSDNGPTGWTRGACGSPGPFRALKGQVYEGGIRVPAIVKWPEKIQPGQVCDTPVDGRDWLPTICSMTGIEAPQDRVIDGMDVSPLFKGGTIHREKPLYWENKFGRFLKIGMREGDWKLVASLDVTNLELYNLIDDPGELKNLAGEYPERVKEMAATMKRIHEEVNAEAPKWPEEPAKISAH